MTQKPEDNQVPPTGGDEKDEKREPHMYLAMIDLSVEELSRGDLKARVMVHSIFTEFARGALIGAEYSVVEGRNGEPVAFAMIAPANGADGKDAFKAAVDLLYRKGS